VSEPDGEKRTPAPDGALAPRDVLRLLRDAGGPVEVEIGMGGGHFLVEYARRNPSRFLIGVERKRHRVVRALKKVQTYGIRNAVVVMGDAQAVLDLLPSGSVAAFHVYFLDPWPKNRHRKRRFLRAETTSLLLDRLEPGGRVLFATDMLDYFMQTKMLFILCGATSADSEPPEETHLSVYATRFRESGTKTYFAVARKP
jgi:tRNA (guanine-N(7)-)-methyltransferase